MRHRVVTKILKRNAEHRRALTRNLSESLILHEKIETTLVKAKYFKPYVEKLITKAKNIDKKNKLDVFNALKFFKTKLTTEEAIKKLIDEVAPRFVKRAGGYTRIVRIGNRGGDNAMMARIELTESKSKSDKEKLTAKQKSKTVKTTKKVEKTEEKEVEVKE